LTWGKGTVANPAASPVCLRIRTGLHAELFWIV
jgi:hypothetical protein